MNGEMMMEKTIPKCKYVKPLYWWVNTKPSGYEVANGIKKAMDYTGFWKLGHVRCGAIYATEKEAWEKTGVLHYCDCPEQCKYRVDGDVTPDGFMYLPAFTEAEVEQQLERLKGLRIRRLEPGTRDFIIFRDRNKCQFCGKDLSEAGLSEKHIHHVHPVSKGGSSRVENLELLCRHCHTEIHKSRGENGKGLEAESEEAEPEEEVVE
jgi:hypothetical protein